MPPSSPSPPSSLRPAGTWMWVHRRSSHLRHTPGSGARGIKTCCLLASTMSMDPSQASAVCSAAASAAMAIWHWRKSAFDVDEVRLVLMLFEHAHQQPIIRAPKAVSLKATLSGVVICAIAPPCSRVTLDWPPSPSLRGRRGGVVPPHDETFLPPRRRRGGRRGSCLHSLHPHLKSSPPLRPPLLLPLLLNKQGGG